MEQAIVNYIREARKHGLEDVAIKQNLLNAGWDAAVVEESFVYEKTVQAPVAAQAFNPANLVHAEISQLRPAHTTIITSPGVTQTPAPSGAQKSRRSAKIALVAAAVIILGGAAYAYFVYGFYNPTKVWQKFLVSGAQASPQVKSQFNFTYKDSLAAFSQEQPPFNNFTLNLSGNTYSDVFNPANPVSSGSYQAAFNTDSGINFNLGADVVLKDNIIYVNVASSTVLSQYFQKYFPGQPVGWVKIDLQKLESMATSDGSALPDSQLDSQIKSIWAKAGIIGIKNYVGVETVSGVRTFHFNNQVDKTALVNAINQSFDALAAFETQKDPSLTIDPVSLALIKASIDSVINSLQVENFQTWIGATDARLYQISASATMPSFLTSVGVEALATARAKARDAKREADMMQISSALELYYNDFGGYPTVDSNGEPMGLTPYYIGVLPTAPEPSDGNCSNYYNTYWYTPMGTKQIIKGQTVYSSYTYSFCIGADAGAHKAGIAQLSPLGIKDSIACTGTSSQCSNTNQAIASTTPTTAEISFSDSLSDYGKTENIVPPSNAIDIYSLMGVSTSTTP